MVEQGLAGHSTPRRSNVLAFKKKLPAHLNGHARPAYIEIATINVKNRRVAQRAGRALGGLAQSGSYFLTFAVAISIDQKNVEHIRFIQAYFLRRKILTSPNHVDAMQLCAGIR
ncbi:hypothetical protein [Massilia putida]|uniref:hypothetical protein n=1 Tax=Massilia putida TaxID=1141883 RepID=UPI0012EC01E2|nr:hypothetical protein [Massilia putida]